MKSLLSKGFTLIEILVAVGIIAFISIVITQVFVATTRSNSKVEILKEVKQNGAFAIDIISRMIRNSFGISSCDATSVTITNPDGQTTTFGCLFDSENNITRIASTSASGSDYLTSSQLTLGGDSCISGQMTLTVSCQTPIGNPDKVSIGFTLAQKGLPVDFYEKADSTFQTEVTLRND